MSYDPAKSKYLPKGWAIKSHRDRKPADPSKIDVKLYGRQLTGSWEDGYDIRKALKNPLGAETLDWLLENQSKIPALWKCMVVFFWGTIYETANKAVIPVGDKDVKLIEYSTSYVRCMIHSQGRWISEYLSLDDEFGPTRVSAELVKPSLWQFIKSLFKKS